MVIDSLSLAPIWKVTVPAPVSSAMPLNCVWAEMREISLQSCVTSSVIEFLSEVDSVPLLNCTARSRTRWSIECTSASEPSAVCTIDTASCALRWAWSRPPIWARSFSLMARPAESSAARLIRKPEDSRSMDLDILSEVATRLRWALNASMLF